MDQKDSGGGDQRTEMLDRDSLLREPMISAPPGFSDRGLKGTDEVQSLFPELSSNDGPLEAAAFDEEAARTEVLQEHHRDALARIAPGAPRDDAAPADPGALDPEDPRVVAEMPTQFELTPLDANSLDPSGELFKGLEDNLGARIDQLSSPPISQDGPIVSEALAEPPAAPIEMAQTFAEDLSEDEDLAVNDDDSHDGHVGGAVNAPWESDPNAPAPPQLDTQFVPVEDRAGLAAPKPGISPVMVMIAVGALLGIFLISIGIAWFAFSDSDKPSTDAVEAERAAEKLASEALASEALAPEALASEKLAAEKPEALEDPGKDLLEDPAATAPEDVPPADAPEDVPGVALDKWKRKSVGFSAVSARAKTRERRTQNAALAKSFKSSLKVNPTAKWRARSRVRRFGFKSTLSISDVRTEKTEDGVIVEVDCEVTARGKGRGLKRSAESRASASVSVPSPAPKALISQLSLDAASACGRRLSSLFANTALSE